MWNIRDICSKIESENLKFRDEFIGAKAEDILHDKDVNLLK